MRIYPEDIENWFLSYLKEYLNIEDTCLALEKLEPYIADLSDIFTVKRPNAFNDYQKERLAVLAYGIFFFPQSFMKAALAITEALEFKRWPVPKDSYRILDLGSSLAPASLSVASLLHSINPNIHIDAVDHSSLALSILNELHTSIKKTYSHITLTTHPLKIQSFLESNIKKKSTYDCIILSFSLNEIKESDLNFFKKIKKLLTPKGLLLILEPALQKTALNLQSITNTLVSKEDFFCIGPSLNPKQILTDDKYWYHEVRNWNPPQSLIIANKKLFRDIYHLKFAYTLLSKESPSSAISPSPNTFRLISPFCLLKSGFVCKGLATDGETYTYEFPTRGAAKSQIKNIKIERGDILSTINLKALKTPNSFRAEGITSITHHYTPIPNFHPGGQFNNLPPSK